MERLSITSGSCNHLNDESVPIETRLRLCRAMWMGREFMLPGKHQLLINWLGNQLGSQKSIQSFKSCLRTMIEMLKSDVLCEEMSDNQHNQIFLKPNLVQAICGKLQEEVECELVVDLTSFGEIIYAKTWIICGVTGQFHAFAQYLSAWMKFLTRKIPCELPENILEVVIQHAGFLIQKIKWFLKGFGVQKKALKPFCKYLLIPSMALHHHCSGVKDYGNSSLKHLTVLIEEGISSILFSRENVLLYGLVKEVDHDMQIDSEIGDANRRHKKVQRLKQLSFITKTLQDVSSVTIHENDPHAAAYYVKLFFELFLTHAKTDTSVKVNFIKMLAKFCCNCQNKCNEGIMSCRNMNIPMILGLLQVSVDHSLYQPSVDQNVAQSLLLWLKELFQNLMVDYCISPELISCICCFVKIDLSITQSYHDTILIKMLRGLSEAVLHNTNVHEFIHCLVDLYIKIRQSVKLVNTIMLLIENTVSVIEIHCHENLCGIVEEFGHYLGNKFVYELSPSLIVEIWTGILDKISEKVIDITSERESSDILAYALHLLTKFFLKIVNQTPIFAVWDHLIVRRDLLKCLENLQNSLDNLYKHISERHKVDIRTHEAYLYLSIIKLNTEDTIKNYASAETETLKPGIQKLIFRNIPEIQDFHGQKHCLVNQDMLTSDDARLAYIHLTLIRFKALTENLVVVKLWSHYHQEELSIGTGEIKELNKSISELYEHVQTSVFSLDAKNRSVLMRAFELLVKFIPVLLQHQMPRIDTWMTDIIVSLVFHSDSSYSDNLEESLNNYLACLNFNVPKGRTIQYKLLKKAFNAVSEIEPGIVELDINQADTILTIDNNTVVPNDKAEMFLSRTRKFLQLLDSMSLKISDHEYGWPVFLYLLQLFKALCTLPENSSLQAESVKVLTSVIKGILKFLDGRVRAVLDRCHAETLFSFFARLTSYLDNVGQGMINSLMHELVVQYYQTYQNMNFNWSKKLQVGNRCEKLDHKFAMCLRAHQISVLTQIISFENRSLGRKRKMRSDQQICKKMKTMKPDTVRGADDIKSEIFADLKCLLDASCKSLSFDVEENSKAYYEMLSECVEASTILAYNKELIPDIHPVIQKFKNTLEDITKDSDPSILLAKLRFVRCCLHCTSMKYEYRNQHLMKFIHLLSDVSNSDMALFDEIKSCLMSLTMKIPHESFQKDVFDLIIGHVRKENTHNHIKCYVLYSTILIEAGIFENILQSNDVPRTLQSQCSRFTKSLLEAFQVLIVAQSQDIATLDPNVVSCINIAMCTILRSKLVKFQITEVCDTFTSLSSLPLESISDTAGPGPFLNIFRSYYEVVHCIVLTRNDIGSIAAICLSAFRHLMRAVLHLGKQKSPQSLSSDLSYEVAVKCSGILEKLFQLIADKNKQDFMKCMSFVVVDYICIIASTTIVPPVKKSITSAVYHLMSTMDNYDIAMVRRSLPTVVRDTFESLNRDYSKNFKYKGFV